MHPHDDPEIPPRLERALRDAYRPTSTPGAAFDQSILDMAGKVAHAAGERRKHAHRRFRRNLLTGLAAALAAGTITAWYAMTGSVQSPVPNVQSSAPARLATVDPRDLNADGRIDILDALLLAEQSQTAAPALDLNADGKVDQRDAHALASEAVKLERGTL